VHLAITKSDTSIRTKCLQKREIKKEGEKRAERRDAELIEEKRGNSQRR
jgi:hypothetical protein